MAEFRYKTAEEIRQAHESELRFLKCCRVETRNLNSDIDPMGRSILQKTDMEIWF